MSTFWVSLYIEPIFEDATRSEVEDMVEGWATRNFDGEVSSAKVLAVVKEVEEDVE